MTFAHVAPCDLSAASMLAKVCTHCASKSSAPITLPALSTATWPAMNRYSDALTRVMCEYWPSGLPRASGFSNLISGMGSSSLRVLVGLQRLAQNLPRRLGAVEGAQGAALDLPAGGGAHELPAVGGDTVDAETLRGAVVRQLDRRAVRVGHQNLQVGRDGGTIAVELDVGQAGEMGEAAGDRGLVLRRLHHRGDSLAPCAADMRATVEHAIIRIDGARVVVGAGVGAGRMAGDQVVDFKPVLDRANAVLERRGCGVALRHDEISETRGASRWPPRHDGAKARQPQAGERRWERRPRTSRSLPRRSAMTRSRSACVRTAATYWSTPSRARSRAIRARRPARSRRSPGRSGNRARAA